MFTSSLTKALRAAVVKAVLITVALVSAFVLAKPFMVYPPDPGAQYKASDMPKVLYDHRWECWTGPQPSHLEGVVPTHAIIRYPDTPWIYTSKATQALEHVFEDKHPSMEVMAFCK